MPDFLSFVWFGRFRFCFFYFKRVWVIADLFVFYLILVHVMEESWAFCLVRSNLWMYDWDLIKKISYRISQKIVRKLSRIVLAFVRIRVLRYFAFWIVWKCEVVYCWLLPLCELWCMFLGSAIKPCEGVRLPHWMPIVVYFIHYFFPHGNPIQRNLTPKFPLGNLNKGSSVKELRQTFSMNRFFTHFVYGSLEGTWVKGFIYKWGQLLNMDTVYIINFLQAWHRNWFLKCAHSRLQSKFWFMRTRTPNRILY